MLNFLSGGRNKQRTDVRDARMIYEKIMRQSRNPVFFSLNGFADSYDGRMEVLCMHLSLVLHTLRRFGQNGERLSQAIYDVMIEDFDIALREEGLSDTGVARRIKPLAKMFFSRAKTYSDILAQDTNAASDMTNALTEFVGLSYSKAGGFSGNVDTKLSQYAFEFYEVLTGLELGKIAKGQFKFPSTS